MSTTHEDIEKYLPPTPSRYMALIAPASVIIGLHLLAGFFDLLGLEWYWVAIAMMMVTTAAPLVVVRYDCEPAAVVYALVASAAAAVWTTAAVATGPHQVDTGLVLVVGGAIVGAFFGPLRRNYRYEIARQRAEEAAKIAKAKAEKEQAEFEKLKKEQEEAYEREPWRRIFADVGFPQVEIARQDRDFGYRLNVTLLTKRSIKDFKDLALELEFAASRVLTGEDRPPKGAITVNPTRYRNQIVLEVNTKDIFAEPIRLEPKRERRSITDPLNLGRYIDGTIAELCFLIDFHMWIVGMTGSGKSVLLHTLITRITQCTDALVWLGGADKGLNIISPWLRPYALDEQEAPVLDWGAINYDECMNQLIAAYQLVAERSETPRPNPDRIVISPEDPAVVLIIDEAPTVMGNTKKYMVHTGEMLTASEIALRITRLGRSEGVYLVLVAQEGTGGILGAEGPSMKRNFGGRVGLQTADSEGNQYIFPSYSVPLHEIERPGELFLSRMQARRPRRARGIFIDVEAGEVSVIAAEHTQWKPRLRIDLSHRLGKRYLDRWKDYRAGVMIEAVRQSALLAQGAAVGTLTRTLEIRNADDDGPSSSGGDGLPSLPPSFEVDFTRLPNKPQGDKPVTNTGLPKLPPPFEPNFGPKPSEPHDDDVERMLTQAEELLRNSAPQPTEPEPVAMSDEDKRTILKAILADAGAAGIRTGDLEEKLKDMGVAIHRSTLHRWLPEVGTRLSYGVWALKTEEGEK